MSHCSYDVLDSLQDTEQLHRRDPHDMMGLVLRFADQCRLAASIGSRFSVRPSADEIRQVVLTGLGGSAIGGDFVRVLMEELGSVPLIVNRDYTLPKWVGPNTLVVAASYSGNTEETVSAYLQAREVGAQRAVITSGGKLAKLAEEDKAPIAIVPGGQPPRSATGFMFFPLMHLLMDAGLLDRALADQIDETLELMQAMSCRFGPEVPSEHNAAKKLAVALHGKLPVVYGSQGYRGAVAMRWKGQFNENAKQAAFANVLPEQNHVEALAWVLAQKQAANWAVIFLRDPSEIIETPRIARRVQITKELVGKETQVHEVWAEGRSLLARMFSLIYFADFMTVYLAILNDVCPTDMATLEYLKAELAKLK